MLQCHVCLKVSSFWGLMLMNWNVVATYDFMLKFKYKVLIVVGFVGFTIKQMQYCQFKSFGSLWEIRKINTNP